MRFYRSVNVMKPWNGRILFNASRIQNANLLASGRPYGSWTIGPICRNSAVLSKEPVGGRQSHVTPDGLYRPSNLLIATNGGDTSAFQPMRRSYSTGSAAFSVAEHGNGPPSESLETHKITQTTSSVYRNQTQQTATTGTVARQRVTANSISPKPPATKYWSHHLHKAPDGNPITIHYCRSLRTMEDVAQYFLDDEVIGFDMEWKASATYADGIKDNVSMIQIASEKRVALFHIASFIGTDPEHFIAPSLRQIVESPNITKVGVHIKADFTRLRRYLGVNARGIFELSHLHRLIKYSQSQPKLVNKRLVNLNDQVEEHFGLPLLKDTEVRCSDWTRPLNYDQVQYAANDPYACICLFMAMDGKRQAMIPVPPRPAHAELDLPIRLIEETQKATVAEEEKAVAELGGTTDSNVDGKAI